jgi:hypothetical protein
MPKARLHSTFSARFVFRLAAIQADSAIMTTRISLAEEADAWCRQLGNFAPIVYRPAAMPGTALRHARDLFLSGKPAARVSARSRAQRRGAAAQFLLAGLITAAMIYPLSGSAQMQGGGMGGHGGHGSHGSNTPSTAATNPDGAVHTPSPLRAMLEEMRKLRGDLLLTSQQIGPWSAMEDALRECVELNRSRMPVVQPGSALDAQMYVQDLADNQRALADAETRFAAATKAAFAVLNPRQLQASKDGLANAIAGERNPATTAES